MAVATYTTDLIMVNDAESGTWGELSGYTGGSAVDAPDADYFIQGLGCASQATGGKTGLTVGMNYDHGTDIGIGWTAGDCIFTWSVFLGGNSIDTIVNGGIRLGTGSADGDANLFYLVGSDYGRNPYGGWQNVVYDPQNTPDQVIGTPTAGVYSSFASLLNMVAAVSKGNLHGVDAIRYGRGEIITLLGDITAYGTFTDMAMNNDYNDITNGYNRWGLFQDRGGDYLWKGLMTLGTTATAVDFRDSNASITIDDPRKTYATFNRIEVNNAASNVEWTGCSFSSLGIFSKGQFEAVDNASITKTSCTFNDMDTFIYQTNSNIITSTYRRCHTVTSGGATINGCTFDDTTALAATPAASLHFASSTEISSGSNLIFNNYLSRYAVYIPATVTGTVSFDNWVFDGSGTDVYWAGLTGTLTVALSNGANATTFQTAAPGTSLVAFENSVSLSITNLRANTEVRIYKTLDNTLLSGIEDVTSTDWLDTSVTPNIQYYKHTYPYNAGVLGGSDTYIMIFNKDYLDIRLNYTLLSTNASLLIQQTYDRVSIV